MKTTTTTATATLYVARLADGTLFKENIVWKGEGLAWKLVRCKRMVKGTMFKNKATLLERVAKFNLQGVTIETVTKKTVTKITA